MHEKDDEYSTSEKSEKLLVLRAIKYDVTLFPWAHGALELPVNPSPMLFLCLSLTSLSKLILGKQVKHGVVVSSENWSYAHPFSYKKRKQSLRSWTAIEFSKALDQCEFNLFLKPKGLNCLKVPKEDVKDKASFITKLRWSGVRPFNHGRATPASVSPRPGP